MGTATPPSPGGGSEGGIAAGVDIVVGLLDEDVAFVLALAVFTVAFSFL